MRRRPLLGVVCVVTSMAASSSVRAQAPAPADLVVVGAHVWTVDDARPEARALAVRGERIVLVGSDAEVRLLIGPGTRVIEGGGRLVLPGLHDGHTHFINSGLEVGQ